MPTSTTPQQPSGTANNQKPPAFDLSTVDWAKTGSDVVQVVQTAQKAFEAGNSQTKATNPQEQQQGQTTVVRRPSSESPRNPMAEEDKATGNENTSSAPIGKMPMSLKISLALASGCAAAFGTHLILDRPKSTTKPNAVVNAPTGAPASSVMPINDLDRPRQKKLLPPTATKKATAKTSPTPPVIASQSVPSLNPTKPPRTAILAGAVVGTALATFTALYFLA